MSQPCQYPGRTSVRVPAAAVAAALTAVLALLLTALVPAPAGAADDPDPNAAATPLTVRLIQITPAVIPAKGRIVLAGTVANSSDETWSAINVHSFVSTTPMTTRDELAAAARSDPDAEVGQRLTGTGQFVAIGDLAPGAVKAFRIELAVKDLGLGAAGVYWIGVHALGTNTEGRDSTADGRARSFIPLVRDPRPTSVAIVVPVRERVARDADGKVLNTTAWSQTLDPADPGGRLGRVAGFLASAGTHAVTTLLDPAVLDAVGDLSKDNPAISFGTDPTDDEPGDDPSEEPGDQPSGSPSTAGSISRSMNRLEPGDVVQAGLWLDKVVAAAKSHTALGLGYADPDVTSLARRRPALLKLSTRLAAETFSTLGIAAVPTVAQPGGWFDDDLLTAVPKESVVLVSDHSAPRSRTRWRTAEQQDLVFTDAQAASGGPAPTTPTDALALRQRIIADSALRSAEGASTPMVVQLPDDWDPGDRWELADFFNALDQPWLSLVGLTPTTDSTTPTFDAALGYPASVRRAEVTDPNVSAARGLVRTTTVLDHLLQTENNVAHDLAGVALNAVSTHARGNELVTRQQVSATETRMNDRIGKVQVIGTDFVTLSGGSGTLAVTLVNGLDQTVVVGIEPRSSTADVRIAEARAVKMAPGQRTVVRLKAHASRVGVTQVVLSPVTEDGVEVGTPLTFRLRTSQVGNLIWGVLGAGGVLLVVMIARRIRRGLREHRWRRA